MKRVAVFGLILCLLCSMASAEWTACTMGEITKSVFDQISNPFDLLNGTYPEEIGFFLAYLAAMDIRADDLANGRTNMIEVSMDNCPFFGISEMDGETAIFFLLPQPKKTVNAATRYKIVYYVFGGDKLYYDRTWTINNTQAYSMMREMCGSKYRRADTASEADALSILDSFIIKAFGEEYLDVARRFLVGKRPINWTEFWGDVYRNSTGN